MLRRYFCYATQASSIDQDFVICGDLTNSSTAPKETVIFTTYRAGNNFLNFRDCLVQLLDYVHLHCRKSILNGDFNLYPKETLMTSVLFSESLY